MKRNENLFTPTKKKTAESGTTITSSSTSTEQKIKARLKYSDSRENCSRLVLIFDNDSDCDKAYNKHDLKNSLYGVMPKNCQKEGFQV